jgi:hypothetical protein
MKQQKPVNKNARGYYLVQGGKDVEIDLGENDTQEYAVVQKEIESGIPSEHNGIRIEWFNAFGIRRRGRDGSLGDYADIGYTVILEALPPGKHLFAYYGGQVHEIDFQTEAGFTRASLAVGDPPMGYGP